MRKLLSILLIMPLCVYAQDFAQGNLTEKERPLMKGHSGVRWDDNLTWEQIKDKAKAENKFIFIDAYTTWCGPCKLMDRDVFPNKIVGEYMNAQFISVKIQMDETSADNARVKSWYAVSRSIKNSYKPEGYPCFLFLASDGSLVHRGIGLLNPEKFIALAKEALANPERQYKDMLTKFSDGRLEVELMPVAARMARKKNDKLVANNIAYRYKKNYLDQLSDKDAFTKDNLLFVAEFAGQLITTQDRYFGFFYNHGNEADSIIKYDNGSKNVAEKIVLGIIKKEEIIEKLYKEGKPINSNPVKWKNIYTSIKNKYGERYVVKYFPDVQITYSLAIKNWGDYVKYVNKKIQMYPPEIGGRLLGGPFDDSWMLNDYAWNLFKYCSVKRILKRGLSWSNCAINLKLQEGGDSSVVVPYFDTKANLLYRIGRTNEAIKLEGRVITLVNSDEELKKGFSEILEKMKKGEPTWPIIHK